MLPELMTFVEDPLELVLAAEPLVEIRPDPID